VAYIPSLSGLTPTSGLTAGLNTAGGIGGGAALGAAGGGLGLLSLLGPAALAFLPSILGKLFGGDPNKKLREQIAALLSQQNINRLTNAGYQQAIGSPAYSQAMGNIATGANAASNTVAQNLAARGIGTTGVGAVLSGLTPSLVGSQTAGLRTTAYESARQQAMDTISKMIETLHKTSGPSETRQLFSGGLSAFSPYLESYLRSHYPSMIPARP